MQQTDSFEASPNTVDDSEIPRPTTGWMYKNLVNNGKKYQPQLDRRISEPSTVSYWPSTTADSPDSIRAR